MVARSGIRSFCEAVIKEFHPQRIMLFGSCAGGRPTADSDVDLLVVMPRIRQRGERVSVKIRQTVPHNFALDLLVRTQTQVAKRLRWGDQFTRDIFDKGKIMCEAPDA